MALVNSTKFRVGYNVSSFTIPATTAGNTLLLIAEASPLPDNAYTPSQLSISGGGAWTVGAQTCTDPANGSDASNPAIAFYAYVGSCSGGATTITFTPPAGDQYNVIAGWLFELSGMDTAGPINTAAVSSSAASVTGSPSVAGCVAFAIGGSHNTSGIWPAGYTDLGSNNLYWYLNGAYDLSTGSGSQTVTNTAANADNLLVVWIAPASGGTIINVSVSEAASLTDSPSAQAHFVSTISEAMTMAETPSVTARFVSALVEAMSLADTVSIAGGPIAASISEAMSLADHPGATARFAAVIVEAATLSDTPGAKAAFRSAIAEAMSLVDTVTLPVVITAAIIEALSLVDAVTITTPAVPKPQLTPPALLMTDAKEHRRQIAQAIGFLYQGKGPTPIDSFTLNANATSTVLIDARIGFYSHVTFMPQTADAAAIASSLWTPQSQQINGQLVVQHASTPNTDCRFRVIIWG